MEKKKNSNTSSKTSNRRYKHIVSAYKMIVEHESSLVNNSIIYNLNNISIPRWKDLSKIQKVAIFFYCVIDDNWQAVTLLFSDGFIANCIDKAKITDFIRRRINENFKNHLGYIPEYLFCIEFTDKRFHMHGAIKSDDNIDLIKRILKTTAFGKHYHHNPIPEHCKIKCESIYDGGGWCRYILKSSKHSKFDIYMRNAVNKRICDAYKKLYLKYRKLVRGEKA